MPQLTQSENIYHLIRHKWTSQESKACLITINKVYDFNHVNRSVILLSNFLASISGRTNHCCAIFSSNSFINIITILACAKENWMCIPLNTSSTIEQIDRQLQICNPSFIAIQQNQTKLPCVQSIDSFECLFSDDESDIKLLKTSNLWDIGKVLKPDEINNEIPFLVTATSGSTSSPKPIVFSQQTKIRRANSAISEWNISNYDVVLNASPFHHSLGQRHLFVALIAGCSLCNIEKFSASKWLELGEKYNVTFSIPVTTHIYELSQYDNFWCLLSQPRFKALVSSSATLTWSLKELLIKNTNGKFYEMYGASEVGTATILHTSITDKAKSVGKAVRGVELTIRDDKMQTLTNSQTGQITIKSFCAFMGYLNKNGELEYFDKQQDMFSPGDLGYLDEDSFLYFKGRTKDVIISGGINIYLIDIQHIVKTNKLIKDAYVFGIDDDKFGSVPAIAVTLVDKTNDVTQISRSIKAFCARNLAPYQMPRYVAILKEFSLLSTGKINNSKVKEEAIQIIASQT